MNAPISKNLIEPKIISNLLFVDSYEDFMKIELQPNETKGAFDNYKQMIYIRSRDRFGVYDMPKIYFYKDIFQKAQSLELEDFKNRCKEIGLDDFKTEVAIKLFIDKIKPMQVWEWIVGNKLKDWSLDYVRTLKHDIKVALAKNLNKY